MDTAPRTMSCIIKQDLGISNDKQDMLPLHKRKQEKKKIKVMLYGKEHYKELLFIDERIFTTEETINKQNNRVYTRSCNEARKQVPRIEQGHYPVGGQCPMTVLLLYIFVKRPLKQQREIINGTF